MPHPSDALVAVAVFYLLVSAPLIHSSTVKGKQGSAPPTHSFTPDCMTLFRVYRGACYHGWSLPWQLSSRFARLTTSFLEQLLADLCLSSVARWPASHGSELGCFECCRVLCVRTCLMAMSSSSSVLLVAKLIISCPRTFRIFFSLSFTDSRVIRNPRPRAGLRLPYSPGVVHEEERPEVVQLPGVASTLVVVHAR